MDLDKMHIEHRKLMEFQKRWEPLLLRLQALVNETDTHQREPANQQEPQRRSEAENPHQVEEVDEGQVGRHSSHGRRHARK